MKGWNKVRGSKCFPSLYHKYLPSANENLNKMEHVLDFPHFQRHKNIIVSAFGQRAYDNHRDAIKANVAQMKAANIPVRPSEGRWGDFAPPRVASGETTFVQTPGQIAGLTMKFGNRF